MMKRIASYILAFVVSLLMWGWLFQCHAQAPGARVGVLRKSTYTPPSVVTPSDFYHTNITVSDGNANAFVYRPYNIENPPSGGWPLAIFLGGDGTNNNNTFTSTANAMSTGDNLTYTHSPSLGSFRMMVSEIIIRSNGDSIGRGYAGGNIVGTGITSGSVTNFSDVATASSTPTVSITFGSSQAGNTITYDYIYSTVFIEGPMRFINAGDSLDGRAIIICIQNITGGSVDYERDYWDNTVTYAWNNFNINPNRISAWGISRGGRQIIDRFADAANSSVLKTRYQFWINETTGAIFTSAGAGRVKSGVASIVLGTASYGGTFTAVNYTNIGIATVHGTSDGVLTNSTPAFSATLSGNNEPLYVYNVSGGFHDYLVWDNQCYNRQYRTDDTGTAPWDYVDFTFKYSKDSLERATLFVEQAEKRRYNTEKDIIDYRQALRQVNALPASSEKTALLGRLSTLKTAIDNGGTRWVVNFANTGGSEASPYNNFTSSTAGTTISNILNFDGGASNVDVELDTNPGGGMSDVGSSRRSHTGGFTLLSNNSGLVLTGFPFGTFKFTDVPSGTYTVRFYHNVGVANFSTDPRLRVTLNSETKSGYSAINTLLGFIEFTGVPHTALAQFDTSYDTSANTILTLMEIFLHP